jgi:hypothetical protein
MPPHHPAKKTPMQGVGMQISVLVPNKKKRAIVSMTRPLLALVTIGGHEPALSSDRPDPSIRQ